MNNHIELHGYLGRDPEMEQKDGKNGKYYQTRFSLGVGRDFGDETDWFNCVINGSKAEIAEKYLHKGSEVIVAGNMESWKGKDDSIHWTVKVSKFDFCGSKGDSKADTGDNWQKQQEDIPF